MLAKNKHWAHSTMVRMNFVKRCGNSKLGHVFQFEELKEKFFFDIKIIIEYEEISDELNWDHIRVRLVPGQRQGRAPRR